MTAKNFPPEVSEDTEATPPDAPKKALSRRNALTVGALSVASLGIFGAGIGSSAAYAASYPSWDDVQKAKKSQSAKNHQIGRIEGLIADLKKKAASAKAAAEQAAEEFFEAQQAFQKSAEEAHSLQKQADKKAKEADKSSKKAGQVATDIYRNGGDDATLEAFLSGDSDGDDLLNRLGTMDKTLDYNSAIYEAAAAARNAAESLSKQAKVKRDERDRLQKVANKKMKAAQKASDAAAQAVEETKDRLVVLEAQLAALKDKTKKTVSQYKKGVEKRRKEAARRAAAAGGGGGGGGGGGSSKPSGSGWARPHHGYISSWYGYRQAPCGGGVCGSTFHGGLDFADGTCGTPEHAAASGTVVYTGPFSGYGNYIKIDHGGGIATGYAHIRNGGIVVRNGQHVSAGQLIAYSGNTGQSVGCHLHFEVYVNGRGVDPAPFLRARGVSV